MSRVISGGVASGKTTKAMQELEAQGGGIFITQNPEEAWALLRRYGFENVAIVPINKGTTVVIDDADTVDVIEVQRTRGIKF